MKTLWRIYRWGKDPKNEIAKFLQAGHSIEEAMLKFQREPEIENIFGNCALNEGLQALIELACGISTPTKWDSTNARLGVGDSATAADPTQTGLQAATNKTYIAMDGTYPQRSGQIAKWRSTFASDDANYAWEEYTVVNAATDAGVNLNRKCQAKGTKSVGESWTLELDITFS